MLFGFGFWMRLFLKKKKKITAFVWFEDYLHVMCTVYIMKLIYLKMS